MTTRRATIPRWDPLWLAASGCGLGYLKPGPGTWGTLGALPIWWAVSSMSPWAQLGVALGVTLFAWFVAARVERSSSVHDASEIVIDEIAGMTWAGLGSPFDLPTVIGTFVAFRLLDITKPPPIRYFDRSMKGGLGVVLDDVAAGAIVAVGMLLVREFLQPIF